MTEATDLASSVQKSITEYYQAKKVFPKNNQAAGVAKAEHLIGNYVTNIKVENGAIHVSLGHRINGQVADKILTLRPATVKGSPKSPISWLCGHAQAVAGMEAQGVNNTTVPSAYLSPTCRAW